MGRVFLFSTLLPQTKEFITEDGLAGTLALKLDTVKVEVAGYGSSTKSVTATRTYPGLADQDTQYIPKSITDNGHSLTLQTVNWQTEGDGHFTAVASYSGSATSSYVKGYTVTADYAGTVSRINVLAHVHVGQFAPVSRDDRLDGSGLAVLRVAGAVDVVLKGAGGDSQGQHQAQNGKKHGQFLHGSLPHQLLCEGLHRHRRLRWHRQPYQPE